MTAVLVLEASTTSAKAMVWRAGDAPRVGAQRLPVGSEVGERDADAVTDAVGDLGRKVVDGTDVDAVALVSTWHGLVLTNEAGAVVGPAYEWPWQGAAGLAARLQADAARTARLYQRTGCMVSGIYPAVRLRQLAADGRDLTGLQVGDQGTHLFHRLTGERRMTWSAASGTGLRDLRTGEPLDEALEAAGLRPEQLTPMAAGAPPAALSASAAARLGVRPGIPVLPAFPDGALSQLGDGAESGGVMTLSMGTSAALRLTVPEPRLSPGRETWCYRGVTGWLSGAATSGCTNCVEWARERLWPAMTFDEIEPLLSAAPIREDAPTFLPFLVGERCPGWQEERSAVFAGVRVDHTTVDLYRAVLEGVLHNIVQCYQALCALHGAPERVCLSGGVLRSPTWVQMVADALGRPVEISTSPHSSLAGGAVLAARHLGVPEPAGSDGPRRVVVPDEAGAARSRRRFDRYLAHYAAGATVLEVV